jgi:hypothetical protein
VRRDLNARLPKLADTLPTKIGCLLALFLGLAACGDPCADLQVICDQCLDPNQKAACEESVDSGADDTCERNIDSYSNVCT